MGNAIIIHSNAVNTPHDATFKGAVSVEGNVDLGNAIFRHNYANR